MDAISQLMQEKARQDKEYQAFRAETRQFPQGAALGGGIGTADQYNPVSEPSALETVRENWLQRRKLLQQQLVDINELLDLIDQTPNLSRIVELSTKFPNQ